ncbi:MAG: NADH-quinone oxidoreductase subunit D [Deltaproteobacteria bacterium]|nr:NADH-quinone oxidoreductase subunit D [Deltaproteobacteria bacterium]
MTSFDNAQTLTFNVGPHHSAAIGPLRMKVRTDGEMVVSCEPDVGYLHRGIEKLAERMTWTGFMPYTDRVDYLSAIHCNLAYALAVESLAGIAVPERAQTIRVLVGELNRLGSHLLAVGHLANQLGAETALMYALRDRERINNLFEMLCGARLTYSYVRIGGVAADVTEGFIEKTYEFVEYLMPKLKEYHDLLSNNRVFMGRLAHVGVISPATAIDCGLTGPTLRASGVKYDTRKMQPYSGYQKFDFDVPVGKGEVGAVGDAFDRYIVRMRELEQAVSIIKQALDALPEGQFSTALPRLFKAPKGEAYAAVESPRGTLGVYVSSSGEKNPARVKFRTPSFAALNLFPDLFKNIPLSDVGTIVGSLDIMVSEVDR